MVSKPIFFGHWTGTDDLDLSSPRKVRRPAHSTNCKCCRQRIVGFYRNLFHYAIAIDDCYDISDHGESLPCLSLRATQGAGPQLAPWVALNGR